MWVFVWFLCHRRIRLDWFFSSLVMFCGWWLWVFVRWCTLSDFTSIQSIIKVTCRSIIAIRGKNAADAKLIIANAYMRVEITLVFPSTINLFSDELKKFFDFNQSFSPLESNICASIKFKSCSTLMTFLIFTFSFRPEKQAPFFLIYLTKPPENRTT